MQQGSTSYARSNQRTHAADAFVSGGRIFRRFGEAILAFIPYYCKERVSKEIEFQSFVSRRQKSSAADKGV